MKSAGDISKSRKTKPLTEAPGTLAKKANRVSQPRKRGIRKVKLNFYVSEKMREKVDAAVLRHDSSLSELLTGAVERCIKDDVWTPKIRNAVSRNRTIVPPAELVDISNQLLALGSVLERLMHTSPDTASIDEASRIYLDARVRLQEMREEIGC